EALYAFSSSNPRSGYRFPSFFHLFARNITIPSLHIQDLMTQKEAIFSLQAQGKWKEDGSAFAFLCKIDEGAIELSARGDRALDEISMQAKISIDSVDELLFNLPPFMQESTTQIQMKGPWKTWKSLIADTPYELPICCKLYTKLQGGLTHLRASAEIIPDLYASKIFFSCKTQDISPFSPPLANLSGKAKLKGFYRDGVLKISGNSPDFAIDQHHLGSIDAFLTTRIEEDSWEGDLSIDGKKSTLPFFSSLCFLWEKEGIFHLSDFLLKTEEGIATSNLKIDLKQKLLDGSFYANISHLDRFSPLLFEDAPIDGNLGIEISFFQRDSFQDLNIELFCKHIRYDKYLCNDLSAHAEIFDLHEDFTGEIEVSIEKLFTPQGHFEKIFLSTYSDAQNWPLAFHLSGASPQRCELNLLGSWQKKEGGLFFLFDKLQAVAAEQNIFLQSPFEVLYRDKSLVFSRSDWVVGEGTFSASGSFDDLNASMEIFAEHFPLELFSIFNPRLFLKGSFSAEGFLEGSSENLQGSFHLALERAHFLQKGVNQPWETKGSLQLHLDKGMLQVHTHLDAIHDQFLEFYGSFPIEYDLYPLKIRPHPEKRLSAELTAEGEIGDLFDFIHLGTHRITGFISTKLLVSQTYLEPFFSGKIELQNGSYANDYTGTSLQNIDAQALASHREIHLTYMEGKDEKKGSFSAEGIFRVDPDKDYPYAISCELENLHTLGSDMISCYLTGPLYITGDRLSALAQGNLKVPSATIRIPDHLPYEIPQLPITYINRPLHLDPQLLRERKIFPLFYDLELTAEDKVYVEGKSLSSEWEGSVHLTGKNLDVAANGSLSLISGDYVFSGKIFKLDEGIILFSDKKGASAHLNLNGTLSLSDMQITAQLIGPLTSPKLTFRSNPHMPTSSILAKILFNKDISDISHPEALQLANTLLSLSGGSGPDVLETIRKTLGVDRLTIASSSSNPNEIALQIGKYLTKGVLVTLSQSPTSSQIIVEVELKKGFIFQAETQAEEEGKFSLKWRKTY
ncbi:MAG: translocation/assembly module TamB, partial [Chlamydiales bacterium]|nr:translocation/assembly module TamB [Chlamydiales bacterium]